MIRVRHRVVVCLFVLTAWGFGIAVARAGVIYEDDFNGDPVLGLNGKSPDTRPGSETWTASTAGTIWTADGSIVSNTANQHRNAFLPFVPSTGNVYTLTVTLDSFSSATDWFGAGFCSSSATGLAFADSNSVAASPWMLQTGDPAEVVKAYVGPGVNDSQVIASPECPTEIQIILKTTNASWEVEWVYNNETLRTFTYTENPSINYVGFGRYGAVGVSVSHFLLTASEGNSSGTEGPVIYSLSEPDLSSDTVWNITTLYQTPTTFPAPDFEAEAAPGITPLFYESEVYTGMTTRVFAWVGIPTNGPGPFPGMVLVHGGGGTAYQDWVQLWMDRGYAAIAMDTVGQIPVRPDGATTGWVRHGYAGPEGGGEVFNHTDDPVGDQWMYHAGAAIIRGHSLLSSYTEVDSRRVGITGISWGGILTCITAGLDDRLRFAAPVYGCGFLGEDSYWLETSFRTIGEEPTRTWLNLWDPSRYVGRAQLPMLFVDGTNDKHFRLGSWQKTYRQPQGTVALCCKVRLNHSDIAGRVPEIYTFADSMLKDGDPLPVITGQGRMNKEVWATYEYDFSELSAVLHYTTDVGPWTGRYWQTTSALLDPVGQRVTAVLPDQTTAYYINLTDANGLIVSTEHEELTGFEHVVAHPESLTLTFQAGREVVSFDLAATARYTIEATTNLLDAAGWADITGPRDHYWTTPVQFIGDPVENYNQRYLRVRSY